MSMTVEEQTEGALAHRLLPDGRVLALYPTIFGTRLGVVPQGASWLDDVWCYQGEPQGLAALASWDGTGEPTGWHRHPFSGRRRPDGDPEQEYVHR